MPFFPRFHYPQTSSSSSGYPIFPTDILRMLDDFENTGSDPGHGGNHNRSRRAFSPNFDVHETEHAYILEGELPGLDDKKNVNLEFTDDKTLMVSGRIERSWSSGTPPSKAVEGASEQKKIDSGEKTEEKAKDQAEGAENKKEQQKKSDVKYWVSERSVGEFSRSFSFPGNVDIDKVKASLEHGVLKIVVPKMEKKGGRRIELS
jgi:HSP20 family protein